MISTASTSEIPQTHAFPVGAELLTKSLSPVPQLELLTLNFHGIWTHDLSNLQPVLRVNHINIRESEYSSKHLVAQGFYRETWEIVVYPVLRKHKGRVKHLLIAEGLLKVKDWLSAPRTPAWLEGRKTLSVIFDEDSKSLRYKEEGNV